MLAPVTSELVHLVGFLTGAVLYGMLLALATRAPARPDPFALATAVLGLLWNLGELIAYGGRGAGYHAGLLWVSAASFTALGFLASVVVHSATRAVQRPWAAVALSVVAYGSASIAGIMHFLAAAGGYEMPSGTGLTWVTAGLVATVPVILVSMGRKRQSRRTLWLAALAIFAVSALHLGRFHGAQESWPVELVGHHASMLLAFAVLYQDYRFAFADLFLKHALTLLALVGVVGAAYRVASPFLVPVDGAIPPTGIGVLLTTWVASILAFPLIRGAARTFVDRVVLERAHYGQLTANLTETIERIDSIGGVLDHTSVVLAAALTASAVTWRTDLGDGDVDPATRTVIIAAGEPPSYMLLIGPLLGGRRLLSDDLAMLDRVALVVARRIDTIRLTGERYERMLQEREMRALATEAELRALRAQINPHFLFNALTTVSYLIQHAPARALRALLRLTTLLRSVLRSEGEITTLGRERELIDCYLQIERERFEERLEYLLDVPDALHGVSIPALLVQPLVENAIKHGISGAVDGGLVSVTARLGDELTVVVRNTGLPIGASSTPGFGVGLRSVERRLRHYYGVHARVTLGRDPDGTTIAAIHIPAHDAEVVESGPSGVRA